ncbi:MAG TPA: class I adenylate-forming enzyme family protein [Acidimicrobiia bacterium]|jgi:acyl-CoA synthetase (AMP-forming)/AMP-acid ligase II
MTGIPERLGAVMTLDPSAPALEFEGRWSTWGELAAAADAVDAVSRDRGLGVGSPVGLMLRNRPVALATLLGLLRAGACVVTVNPLLGAERLRADLPGLGLPLLLGAADDLALVPAAELPSTARGELGSLGGPIAIVAPVDTLADPPAESSAPGVAVRMLTSGTTGPPKRIDLRYEMLDLVMRGAKHYETGTGSDVRLRSGVVIVNAPLVHVSGVFRVVQATLDGRRIALLERFTVDGWTAAVREHRPKTVSLVPTALRMVLDADVDDEVFDSIRSVVSGTAPLDPDLAEAFSARYRVPVLTSYGATEFGGGVAGWNLADHEEFAGAKRGSVGRAHAGCSLRVVDPDDGHDLGIDTVGLLEVRAPQLGTVDWVRTTDLARLDADGFLWIVGRADQTILRGGYKVQPEVVRAALERVDGVAEAAVVGIDDERLGAVPVAAVERRPGATLDEAAVLAAAGAHLARYEMPVSVTVVDALPRTASGKADLAAVRQLITARADA